MPNSPDPDKDVLASRQVCSDELRVLIIPFLAIDVCWREARFSLPDSIGAG
jgi:hypothetical protein